MTWRWGIAQWFELRWWKKYLGSKSKQEYLAWKKDYWKKILSLISVKVQPADTIADIGCGPAGIFIALAGNQVTAVDPLLDKYEGETSVFRKADYPRVSFIKSAIEEFNPAEKFEIVFCMNAINHVHDIEKGINKLKEICSSNGTVVISIDAHNHSIFKYLFRIMPFDILHPHQYDLKEYKRMLQKNNWKTSVPYLLEQGFFFNHYLLVCRKLSE